VAATLANHAYTHTRRATPCTFHTRAVTAGGDEESGRCGASLDAREGASGSSRRRGPYGGSAVGWRSPESSPAARFCEHGDGSTSGNKPGREPKEGGVLGDAPAHQGLDGVLIRGGGGPRWPESAPELADAEGELAKTKGKEGATGRFFQGGGRGRRGAYFGSLSSSREWPWRRHGQGSTAALSVVLVFLTDKRRKRKRGGGAREEEKERG
jgi:hypothetical protein